MKNISSSKDLQKKIAALEFERTESEIRLKENWEDVKESFRPVNIVKRSLKDMVSSTNKNSSLLGSIAALGVGLLARRLVGGKSPNGPRKWLGAALAAGISTILARKPSGEKKRSFLSRIFSKKKKPELLPG